MYSKCPELSAKGRNWNDWEAATKQFPRIYWDACRNVAGKNIAIHQPQIITAFFGIPLAFIVDCWPHWMSYILRKFLYHDFLSKNCQVSWVDVRLVPCSQKPKDTQLPQPNTQPTPWTDTQLPHPKDSTDTQLPTQKTQLTHNCHTNLVSSLRWLFLLLGYQCKWLKVVNPLRCTGSRATLTG